MKMKARPKKDPKKGDEMTRRARKAEITRLKKQLDQTYAAAATLQSLSKIDPKLRNDFTQRIRAARKSLSEKIARLEGK